MSNPLPMPPSASAADPLMTTLPPATLIVSVAWMAPAHVAESLNPCLHTRKGRQMRQEGFPAEPLPRLYASVAISIFKRFLSQQSASGHDWTAPGYCQTLGLAGSFGQTSCWKRAWRVNGWLHCNAGADIKTLTSVGEISHCLRVGQTGATHCKTLCLRLATVSACMKTRASKRATLQPALHVPLAYSDS